MEFVEFTDYCSLFTIDKLLFAIRYLPFTIDY